MMCSEPSFLNVRIYINFQLVVFVICLIPTNCKFNLLWEVKKVLLEPKTTVRSPANFCRHWLSGSGAEPTCPTALVLGSAPTTLFPRTQYYTQPDWLLTALQCRYFSLAGNSFKFTDPPCHYPPDHRPVSNFPSSFSGATSFHAEQLWQKQLTAAVCWSPFPPVLQLPHLLPPLLPLLLPLPPPPGHDQTLLLIKSTQRPPRAPFPIISPGSFRLISKLVEIKEKETKNYKDRTWWNPTEEKIQRGLNNLLVGVLTETITGVTIEYFYSFFLFLVPKNIWTVILDNLVIIMFYLGQRMLSKVHQMGKQREGNLQAGGQQGGLQTVGAP